MTYGYQKTADTIAITQLSALTAIDERGVRRVLADLVKWKILHREGGGQGRGNRTRWSVVKDFDEWSVEGNKTGPMQTGLEDPVKSGKPGAHTLVSFDVKPGAGDPLKPGAQTPLQRHKDRSKDSGGVTAPDAPLPDWSSLARQLKGKVPIGRGGEAWKTPAEWLDHHGPLIAAEAEKRSGCSSGKAFWDEFKITMHRFWNTKSPTSARGSPLASNGDAVHKRAEEMLSEL